MGFLKKLFKKLNPTAPMNKVYGGPEYFKKKNSEIKCVYAGPEYFEKKRKQSSMEDVYNGPEFYEREKKEADIEDVYNGPEEDPVDDERDYRDENTETADDTATYPGNHAIDDQYPQIHAEKVDTRSEEIRKSIRQNAQPIGFVYAGPGYIKNKPDGMKGIFEAVYAVPQNPSDRSQQAMFWAVYAGPGPMNQAQFQSQVEEMIKNNSVPVSNGNEPKPYTPGVTDLPEGGWICSCGYVCTGKFCPNCGSPRKDNTPRPGGPENPTMLA